MNKEESIACDSMTSINKQAAEPTSFVPEGYMDLYRAQEMATIMHRQFLPFRNMRERKWSAALDKKLRGLSWKLIPELMPGVVYNGSMRCMITKNVDTSKQKPGAVVWKFLCTHCNALHYAKIGDIREGFVCRHSETLALHNENHVAAIFGVSSDLAGIEQQCLLDLDMSSTMKQ